MVRIKYNKKKRRGGKRPDPQNNIFIATHSSTGQLRINDAVN